MKKHQHKLLLLTISRVFPVGSNSTSTSTETEFAYFLCEVCDEIIKKEVKTK